jgi:hypothetical protein
MEQMELLEPLESTGNIFKRAESLNISNQGLDKTCYAHTSARVILKLIRVVVPEMFTPFINDECNQHFIIYLDESINLLFQKISNGECSESSKNYLLLFIFIYTIIIERPIRFNRPGHAFFWFETNLQDILTNKTYYTILQKKYSHFSEEYYDKIIQILAIFSINIYSPKYNGLETLLFEPKSDGPNLELAENVLRYYLDKGFYFGLTSHKFLHAVSVTGYIIDSDGDFCLEIKNSWGKTNREETAGLFIGKHIEGIVIEKFKDVLETFNAIETIVPVRLGDEDSTNPWTRNPSLDVVDAIRRARYKEGIENKQMKEEDIRYDAYYAFAGKKRKRKKKTKKKKNNISKNKKQKQTKKVKKK